MHGKKDRWHLIVAGGVGCGVVGAQKSTQELASVGFAHAVNKIRPDFVVGRFPEQSHGNVDTGSLARAGLRLLNHIQTLTEGHYAALLDGRRLLKA